MNEGIKGDVADGSFIEYDYTDRTYPNQGFGYLYIKEIIK